jgi:hypothetical protein
MTRRMTIGLGLAMLLGGLWGVPAHAIPINPDGTGVDPVIQVGALDWNVGNSIIKNIESGQSQSYAHSQLSAFDDVNGVGIGGTGLLSSYEWTYVLGVKQDVSQAPAVGTSVTTTLTTTSTAENFFRIYYDPLKNANQLLGTGFNNGTLILSGVIEPNGVNTFTADLDPSKQTKLDSFGADNYPGIKSVPGTGGGTMEINVLFSNPAFFPSTPTHLLLNFSSQNVLPYNQTNPSAKFTDGANNTVVPGATVASIGNCNGCLGETAPNVMVQVDANTAFPVPEPAIVTVMGLGLGLLATALRSSARRHS